MRLGSGDPKVFSLIEAIGRSVKRITYQIDDVLNNVRNTDTEKSLFNVRQIISSCIKKAAVPENVKVDLPEDDLEVFCDCVKIEIVFENLVRNSIQAIGASTGKIKTAFDRKVEFDTVMFSNSGPGIPGAILSKIFEPLFTTKGDRTGLGLTTCKNLLEQHGWTITAIPASTFLINIPKNGKSICRLES